MQNFWSITNSIGWPIFGILAWIGWKYLKDASSELKKDIDELRGDFKSLRSSFDDLKNILIQNNISQK